MNKNEITEELLKRRSELAKELAEVDAMLAVAGHPAATPAPVLVPFPMPYPVPQIVPTIEPHPMTPWQVRPYWQIERQDDLLNPWIVFCETKPTTGCAPAAFGAVFTSVVGGGINAGGLS